jgi:protein phosphatase
MKPNENEKIKHQIIHALKDDPGPFDIIGDIHGCYDELVILLGKLGYHMEVIPYDYNGFGHKITHPDGKRVIFVGDLVDRGPRIADVLKIVMSMVKSNIAYCVIGNHDDKLLRKLKGSNVQIAHGLEDTLDQLKDEPKEFMEIVKDFLDNLPVQLVVDQGRLIIAHAGMKEEYHGRYSKGVKSFALFGQPTGKTDEHGLPERYDWAKDYKGKPLVIYGHTPMDAARWINNTMNLDTGCVFGGKLTALRYPQNNLIDTPALYTYYETKRPFLEASLRAPLRPQ